jgi:uncharacterized protein YndB with AHSA1/START domain
MTQATLVRRIAARPALVFEALITAEAIDAWWGPDDVVAVAAVCDPRVGGAYEVRFRTADGTEHVCAGAYLAIARPEHLVMSWRWLAGGVADERDRVSRLEFRLRAIDIGTELTLVHSELCTDDSARLHEGGWSGALGRLVGRFVHDGGRPS